MEVPSACPIPGNCQLLPVPLCFLNIWFEIPEHFFFFIPEKKKKKKKISFYPQPGGSDLEEMAMPFTKGWSPGGWKCKYLSPSPQPGNLPFWTLVLIHLGT